MSHPLGLALTAIDLSDIQTLNQQKDALIAQLANGCAATQSWVSVDNPHVLVVVRDTVNEQASAELASGHAGSIVCQFAAQQIVPGNLPSPQGAGGLLISSLNIPAELDDEFNAWCTEEHVARLAKVPGVLSARRYKTSRGVQGYVNMYHLTSPDVQASDAWKDAVNTPWSARLRPHFYDKLRIVSQPLNLTR